MRTRKFTDFQQQAFRDARDGAAAAAAKANPRAYQEALELQEELHAREQAALLLYQPMPFQAAFHESRARFRLIHKANRAGGSTASMVELARAAMRCDPHQKFRNDEKLVFWVVGYGESHIGNVFHRMLFQRGLFQIIRDEKTREWRVYNPYSDLHREAEAMPAPPLIPERFIDGKIAWKNKAANQFEIVPLTTGASIHAYTSGSDMPPMGSPVHGILLDEDIAQVTWVTEMMARLPDVDGRLWWAAAHTLMNEAMMNLSGLAAEEVVKKEHNPAHELICEEFNATIYDNIYVGEKAREETIVGWRAMGGEDEVTKRALGQVNTSTSLMYPTVSQSTHGMTFDEYDKLGQAVGWTRYMVVDPGWDITAVLFAAVPPPEVGDYALAEDCLYMHNKTVDQFADAVANKINGRVFRSFIIDDHGARPHNQATGRTLKQLYTDALRERKVASQLTGHGFRLGCDDPESRQAVMRKWLMLPEGGGYPRFRVLLRTMGPLFKELARYRRKYNKQHGVYLDVADPISMQKSHITSCCEYLVADNPGYYPPPKDKGPDSPANRRYEELRKKRKARVKNYVNLGPRERVVA